MKSSRGASAKKKLFIAFGLMIVLVIGLFLFPGCQNNPNSQGGGTAPPVVVVANLGAHSVMVFERHNNGSLADTPVSVIRGPATGLHNPFDVAIDDLDRIWVANLGDPPASNPSITVYEPNSNGNTAPSFTFPLTGLIGINFVPGSFAKFGAEVMLVAGVDLGAPSPRSGNTNPTFELTKAIIDSTIHFESSLFSSSPSQIINPTGIAFKSDTIFVAVSSLPLITGSYTIPNPPPSAILLYGRGSHGFDTTSTSMISGNNTELSNPAHIELDRSGNLFVLNQGIPGNSNSLPSITVYASGQRGNVAPVRTIRGPNTGLVTSGVPYGIAVDVNGFIYVSTNNRILVFDQTANGNASPVATLQNTPLSGAKNTDLSSPVGIAVR